MVFNTAWISSTSTLGPTKEEPMFQVQTPSRINCFGNKHTILKDGLDKLAAPLASVGKEKGNGWRKSHSLIQVSGRGGGPDLSIRMENDYSNTHPFHYAHPRSRNTIRVEKHLWWRRDQEPVRRIQLGLEARPSRRSIQPTWREVRVSRRVHQRWKGDRCGGGAPQVVQEEPRIHVPRQRRAGRDGTGIRGGGLGGLPEVV